MKETHKNNLYPLILGFGTFIFIFLFFSQMHPVYPYDADDWTYLYNTRSLYPSTNYYNPSRILPEILMPISGQIAMSIVYPFVKDISISICITTSILLAIVVTLYVLSFYRMLRKETKISASVNFLLSILFLLFHFLFFRSDYSDNQHLFYSFDLCCHYNYTIPNILAGSLVFLFISDKFEYFNFHRRAIIQGTILLAIFLIVFSHVFSSIILTAYLGSLIIVRALKTIRQKEKISDFFHRYILHFIGITLWLIALCFEAFGNRADAVAEIANMTFFEALKTATGNYLTMIPGQTNVTILFYITTVVIFSYWTIIKQRELRKWTESMNIILCSAMISSIYLVLMAAKSYPYYLLRAMTIFAVPFFIILFISLCSARLLSTYPKWRAVLPALLLFIYCEIQCRENTFQDVQTLNIKQQVQGTYRIPPLSILQQNNTNIKKIIDASQLGIEEMTLVVPHFEQEDNWPLSYYYGKRLSRFLSKYGLLENDIEVNTDFPKSSSSLTIDAE